MEMLNFDPVAVVIGVCVLLLFVTCVYIGIKNTNQANWFINKDPDYAGFIYTKGQDGKWQLECRGIVTKSAGNYYYGPLAEHELGLRFPEEKPIILQEGLVFWSKGDGAEINSPKISPQVERKVIAGDFLFLKKPLQA